jgi:adenylate cyclase
MIYHILRRIGIGAELGVIVDAPLSKLEGFRVAGFIGLLTGIFYAILELLFETRKMKRKSVGFRIFIKTICYTFLMMFMITVASNYVGYITGNTDLISRELIIESGAIWSIGTFFLISSLLFGFIRLVNEKFGPGILVDMIIGKYRSPRVEKKIFMFLDLTSSITIAEELGYMKYSSLIQQCFYDLNDIVQKFDGQIYQYVGDEAVICWDYDKGVKENACIDFYFAYSNLLEEKREFYETEFGVFPKFKAGLHGGELVVTEVGVIKKEIAYHGDVINTTARIQKECKKYGAELLISGFLFKDLEMPTKWLSKGLGEVNLQGKNQSGHLHSVKSL